jgi:hypothetical protein
VVSFWDFEGRHAGETVWVLGSGPTLDFVGDGFFDGKTVVATNHSWKGRADHAYACSNHWSAEPAAWLVVTETEQVPPQDQYPHRPAGDNVIVVPSIDQRYSDFRPAEHWPDRGRFVVGPTSLHLSMHWAVWLGAAHIVLVGADCGVIDGRNNADGYYTPKVEQADAGHYHHRLWERTLNEMAAKIRTFGVSVHSLNPWTTFGLEGHEWRQDR